MALANAWPYGPRYAEPALGARESATPSFEKIALQADLLERRRSKPMTLLP